MSVTEEPCKSGHLLWDLHRDAAFTHTHSCTHTKSTAHPHSLSPRRGMAGVGWSTGCKGFKSQLDTQAWGPERAAGPPWASASSWDRTAPCTVDQGLGVHRGSAHWKQTRDISPPESPWTPGLRLSNNFVTSKYFQQSLPKELSNSLKPFEGRCLYYGRISFWGGSQSYMESK